jgi:hypothetical protein
MLPDFERADRIGEFWGYPESRAFAELLIDCEEDGHCERCWSECCGRPRSGKLVRLLVRVIRLDWHLGQGLVVRAVDHANCPAASNTCLVVP